MALEDFPALKKRYLLFNESRLKQLTKEFADYGEREQNVSSEVHEFSICTCKVYLINKETVYNQLLNANISNNG